MTERQQGDRHGGQGVPRLREWLERASLEDILSSAGHSRDFDGSRAEYIYIRVRLLAFLFAAVAPLWAPVDYLFLAKGQFIPMLGLRLIFSGLLVMLGLWTSRPHQLSLARLRLFLFILVPALFFVGSRLVLGAAVPEVGILVGYSFLPFVLVALLAVFPLTLLEGVAYALAVLAVMVATDLWFGTLFTVQAFGDIWLLELLTVIALWAEVAQLHMLLRLYREATRDSLTGLVNRRVLTKWLTLEIRRARRTTSPLSVLLFDLDLFKRINDTHGHLSGDLVLQEFARIMSEQLQGNHLCGRQGGEEFLAILPGQDADAAKDLGECIADACRHTTVVAPDGSPIRFTTSVGVAQLYPGEGADSLLDRVDQGLYQAKTSGRDLVALAP